MKRKWGAYLFILLVFVVGFSLGGYSHYRYISKIYELSVVNSGLFDIDVELDLLDYWHENMPNNKFVKEHLDQQIFTNLYYLSITQPKIEILKGTPLKALGRAITFHNTYNYDFDMNGRIDDSLNENLNSYLASIEKEVTLELKRRLEITKSVKEHFLPSKD